MRCPHSNNCRNRYHRTRSDSRQDRWTHRPDLRHLRRTSAVDRDELEQLPDEPEAARDDGENKITDEMQESVRTLCDKHGVPFKRVEWLVLLVLLEALEASR